MCWCLRHPRQLVVAAFCGNRYGERWCSRRVRYLGQVRVHRLLTLLRRRILVRIRGLRCGRLLAAVQVRNLLQI